MNCTDKIVQKVVCNPLFPPKLKGKLWTLSLKRIDKLSSDYDEDKF